MPQDNNWVIPDRLKNKIKTNNNDDWVIPDRLKDKLGTNVKKKEQSEPTTTDSEKVAEPLSQNGGVVVEEQQSIDSLISEKEGQLPTSEDFFNTPQDNVIVNTPSPTMYEDIAKGEELKAEVDKKTKQRAFSLVDKVSTYGKEASIKRLYHANQEEIDNIVSELSEDEGVDKYAIEEAISERIKDYKKDIDTKIITDKKTSLKDDLVYSAMSKVVDTEKYKPQIFKRETDIDKLTDPIKSLTKELVPFDKLTEEDKKKVKEEVSKDYKAKIDLKMWNILSDEDKELATNNSEFENISKQLKEELSNEEADNQKIQNYKKKLTELELKRRELTDKDRLYNPFNGSQINKDEANNDVIEFNNNLNKLKEEYSYYDNLKKVAEDNLLKLDYWEDKLNEKVRGEETYRDLMNSFEWAIDAADFENSGYRKEDYEYAQTLKREYLDAKAKAQAVSWAIETNQDPASIKRGIFKESGFLDGVERGFMESIGKDQHFSLEEGAIATGFVDALQDSEFASTLTKEQKDNAKETLMEKAGYGTGATIPVMGEIIVSSALTEGVGGALQIAKWIPKATTVFKSERLASLFNNVIQEGVKGAITFAPTSETAATGAGEGFAKGVFDTFLPENLLGKKYGKLLNFAIRSVGGGTTEGVGELFGQYTDALNENGYDLNESFNRAFGRTPEERWENLTLIGIQSLMFSSAFNAPRLVQTRKALQTELDNGNVPKEDVDSVTELVKTMDEKIEADNDSHKIIDGENEVLVTDKELELKINDDSFLEAYTNGDLNIEIKDNQELSDLLEKKAKEYSEKQEMEANNIASELETILTTKNETTTEEVQGVEQQELETTDTNGDTTTPESITEQEGDGENSRGVTKTTEAKLKEQTKETPISRKEELKQSIDTRLKNIRKGGLTVGGLNNLNDLAGIIKDLIELGVISLQDIIKEVKKQRADIDESLIEKAFNIAQTQRKNAQDFVDKIKENPKDVLKIADETVSELKSKGFNISRNQLLKDAKGLLNEKKPRSSLENDVNTNNTSSRKRVFDNIEKIAQKINDRSSKKANPKELNDRIFEATLPYLQESKWYEQATDKERETAYRELAKKYGQKIKSSPRSLPKKKQIIIKTTEEAELKNQIRTYIRGFKDALKDKKDIIDSINKYAKARLPKVDLRKSEVTPILTSLRDVETTKDFIKAVESIDNLADRLEIRDRVNKLNKAKKVAKANLKTKLGQVYDEANTLLRLKEVPKKYIKEYEEVVGMMGQKGSVIVIDPERIVKLHDDITKELNVEDNVVVDRNLTEDEIVEKIAKEKDKEARKKRAIRLFERAVSFINRKDIDFGFDKINKRVIQFLNLPKEYLETLSHTELENLVKEVENIKNGFLSNGVVVNRVAHYLGHSGGTHILDSENILGRKDSKEAIDDVDNTTPEIDEMLKEAEKDTKEATKKAKKFSKQSRKRMRQHISRFVKSIRNIAFYQETESKIAQAYEAKILATNKVHSKYNDLFKKAIISKIGRVNFKLGRTTDGTFEMSTMFTYLLRELEHQANPNNKKTPSLEDIFAKQKDDYLNRGNNLNLNDKDWNILKESYNNISKNKKEGKIDIDAAIKKNLTKEEQDLLNFIRDEYKKSKDKYIYISHIKGVSPITTNEFSHRSSVSQDQKYGSLDSESFFNNLLNGGFTTGAIEERISGVPLIKPTALMDFITYVDEINTVYYMADVANQVKATISTLKKEGNKTSKAVANALMTDIQENIRTTFHRTASNSSTAQKIAKILLRRVAVKILISATRLLKDATNYIVTIPKIPSILSNKESINKIMKSDTFNKLIEEFGSTQGNRIFNISLGTMSSDIKELDVSKTLRKGMKGTDVSFGDNLVNLLTNNDLSDIGESMSNMYYKVIDKALPYSYMSDFLDSFKKSTGKDFDIDKYNNDIEYQAENEMNIRRALSAADKSTSDLYNTSSAYETKLKGKDRNSFNVFNILSNFMQSFTYNESATLRDSFTSIFGNGTMDRKQAISTFTTLTVRSIMYSAISDLLFKAIYNIVDDDESDDVLEALESGVNDTLFLAFFGNLPSYQKAAIGASLNLGYEYYIKEIKKQPYNKDKDNLVYSGGFSTTDDALILFGGMGSVIITYKDFIKVNYDIISKYYETGVPPTLDDLVELKAASLSYDALLANLFGLPLSKDVKSFEAIYKRLNKNKKSSGSRINL